MVRCRLFLSSKKLIYRRVRYSRAVACVESTLGSVDRYIRGNQNPPFQSIDSWSNEVDRQLAVARSKMHV